VAIGRIRRITASTTPTAPNVHPYAGTNTSKPYQIRPVAPSTPHMPGSAPVALSFVQVAVGSSVTPTHNLHLHHHLVTKCPPLPQHPPSQHMHGSSSNTQIWQQPDKLIKIYYCRSPPRTGLTGRAATNKGWPTPNPPKGIFPVHHHHVRPPAQPTHP
jgi:hypothetical protein